MEYYKNYLLFEAIECGQEERVKELIKKGAVDVNILYKGSKTWNRKTPLNLAVEKNNYEIANILVNAKASLEKALHAEAESYWCTFHEDCVLKNIQFLLKFGADVNAKVGSRASHILARSNVSGSLDEKMTSIFLKAGADVNIADNGGVTPLHMAGANCGKLDVIRLMLESGARVNMEEENGLNALIYYVLNGEVINKNTFMLLLAAGEKVDIERMKEDVRVVFVRKSKDLFEDEQQEKK